MILPESLVFIVAIVISSECYLSTLFAIRPQCRPHPFFKGKALATRLAYTQASAHYNPSESQCSLCSLIISFQVTVKSCNLRLELNGRDSSSVDWNVMSDCRHPRFRNLNSTVPVVRVKSYVNSPLILGECQ